MSLNVLIVDDSDVIRAMIARTLRLARVPVGTVFEACNGLEALSILKQDWVDLVLADINMPVMDGAEMLARMRERSEMADIPVIVVSSDGASERISALTEQGVTAWIRKPFTPEDLRDAICALEADLMPASEQAAQIDAVFGPVLETFAFAYPEFVEVSQLPDPEDDVFSASITFEGATCGVMTISAPSALCAELAANILGTDPDDPDARLRGADTLGEIVNIAAGHLASLLEPARATSLNPPVVQHVDRAEWERQVASDSSRTYVVEGRPVVVTVGLRALKAAS
jgi:two-component system chemotaxis response regulator CheY